MINVRDRTCEDSSCAVRPTFAYPHDAHARFCRAHMIQGMINVKDRTCEGPGCSVRPSFAYPRDEHARFCSTHKEDDMIDVVHRTCENPSCVFLPSFAYSHEKRGRFCGSHRLEGMINVADDTCEDPGCSVRPRFAEPHVRRGRFCVLHKREGMINVVDKICEEVACNTRAQFGLPGFSVSFCAEHKREGQVRDPRRRCEVETCRNPAIYGALRASRCELHRSEDDINFIERRCVSCNLLWTLCARGLCRDCRGGSQMRLAKQREVRKFLETFLTPDERWTSYDTRTRALAWFGDRERPDFYWDRGSYAVVLEVDEHQHADRPELCECARMFNITSAEGRPTFFLRFNPDSYVSGDPGNRTVPLRRRLPVLLERLRQVLYAPPEPTQDAAFDETNLSRRGRKATLPWISAVLRLFFDGYAERRQPSWQRLLSADP